MLELDRVFAEYLPNSEEIVAGEKTRRRLTPERAADIDAVITQRLPELLTSFVEETGRDISRYRVYGSVGQPNWTLAYIPWVAILRRDITRSTERGYYVVLLFSQDMQSCFLSLNQGFTQTALGGIPSDDVATQRAEAGDNRSRRRSSDPEFRADQEPCGAVGRTACADRLTSFAALAVSNRAVPPQKSGPMHGPVTPH
jgi:MrcB-like, N-terminal domain